MIEFFKFIFSNGWIFLGFSFLLYLIIKAISVFKPIHIHKYYLDSNKVDKTNAINIADSLKSLEEGTIVVPSEPIPAKETSMNDSVWDLILNSF